MIRSGGATGALAPRLADVFCFIVSHAYSPSVLKQPTLIQSQHADDPAWQSVQVVTGDNNGNAYPVEVLRNRAPRISQGYWRLPVGSSARSSAICAPTRRER
jgi:hypothetical protein